MAADRPHRPAGADRRRAMLLADASRAEARPDVLARLDEACTPPPRGIETALRPYLETIARMRAHRPGGWVADAHRVLTEAGIISCGRDHFRRTIARMLAEGARSAAGTGSGGKRGGPCRRPEGARAAHPGPPPGCGLADDAAAVGGQPLSSAPGDTVEPDGPAWPAAPARSPGPGEAVEPSGLLRPAGPPLSPGRDAHPRPAERQPDIFDRPGDGWTERPDEAPR